MSIIVTKQLKSAPVAAPALFPIKDAATITVDIIIPCYNYGRYLSSCVHSVLLQQGVSIRILIIDDASVDDTEVIARTLAEEYSVVEYRRHVINKGHIATYNEGIVEWSTSDYVVLLSADDLLAPGSLERATQVMEMDPTIGMVYGRAVHFGKESELPKFLSEKLCFIVYDGSKWLEERFRAGYNVISSPEVVVRGSVQRAIGGYKPLLPHSGDLEMWLRIASISNIGYIQNRPQAFYRVHAASMQRTEYKNQINDFVQRKAAFDYFLWSAKLTVAQLDRLTNLVHRSLAREALWDACRTYDRNRVKNDWVQQLVDFALAAYPTAEKLPEYRALLRRRLLGPLLCHYLQLFIVPATAKWINRKLRRLRWKYRGI